MTEVLGNPILVRTATIDTSHPFAQRIKNQIFFNASGRFMMRGPSDRMDSSPGAGRNLMLILL
ncbi:hypothetical protein MPER_08121 [Moniliophthora perniciosa FA553]|nr:hypothetical protein MPER_08121 [Moniliophthora perniciosa FA553]